MELNRKQRRELEKITKKMTDKDKFEMYSYAATKATQDALMQSYPQVIELGEETAYMHLYDEYLSDFNKIDEQEQKNRIESLISFIGVKYLKAKQKRLDEQNRVADVQEELKKQESEKQNG